MALTVKQVEKLKQRSGRYGDGHGLYLQVLSPTSHSWLLRYERGGKERWMGLGATHTFTLEEARARARKARQQLADGIDPIATKRAEQAARALEAAKNVTFAEVARQYYDAHSTSWSNRKHRQQFLSTLRDYASSLSALPVAAIDEAMVLAVLRPVWGTKTPTAKRVRNRIAAVLDYASASGYRKGDNPARWEGHLEHLLADPEKIKPVAHHAALPFVEISKFIAELRKVEGIAARALEFTVLTAARTGEVREATWDEVDFQARTWVIPAVRMKMSKEHRVPLSDRAVELLRTLPREANLIFAGARAGTAIGNSAMFLVLKDLRPDCTVHGFRSTFSTWAHETTAFAGAVIELSLAHSVGNAVERAYRRSDLLDQRRKLMETWAKYCSTKPPAEGANVVTLSRSAQQ